MRLFGIGKQAHQEGDASREARVVPALPAPDDDPHQHKRFRQEQDAHAQDAGAGGQQRPVLPEPHARLRRAGGADAVLDAFTQIGLSPRYVAFAQQRAQQLREPLAVALRDMGLATGEQIARALAIAHETEYVDPHRVDDLDLVRLRASELRQRATVQMVPVQIEPAAGGVVVSIAIADEAVLAGTSIDVATHWRPFAVRAVVASRETLATLWQRLYADSLEAVLAAEAADPTDLDYARKLLEAVLRHACFSGCSDLHFTPTDLAGMLRVRKDGMLRPLLSFSQSVYGRVVGLLVNAGGANELALSREAAYPPPADLAARYGFRVQLTRTVRGIAAVIRVLDRQSAVVEFGRLGFDSTAEAHLLRFAQTSEGLVLVTGPTGSGKTTTLFALMRTIDGMAHSIHTVENPVELHCPQWHQSQVAGVQGMTEAEAFRAYAKAFLRSDPDQCLVGELRDAPTVLAAIDLANTGHTVFATLHANDAPRTLQRLRELGVPMDSIAAVLTGVLAQRLIPRLCPHCKTPDSYPATFETLRLHAGASPYRSVGCPSCEHTGYAGRVLVYEVLAVNTAMRDAIARGDSPMALASSIAPQDRMWGRGLALVANGLTTVEALRSQVEEPS